MAIFTTLKWPLQTGSCCSEVVVTSGLSVFISSINRNFNSQKYGNFIFCFLSLLKKKELIFLVRILQTNANCDQTIFRISRLSWFCFLNLTLSLDLGKILIHYAENSHLFKLKKSYGFQFAVLVSFSTLLIKSKFCLYVILISIVKYYVFFSEDFGIKRHDIAV